MLLQINKETIIDAALIELISDRGDGALNIDLRNGERAISHVTIEQFGTAFAAVHKLNGSHAVRLVAIDDIRAVPASSLAIVRKRSDGRADIETVGGAQYVSRDAFSTIAPLPPL